MPSPNTDKLAVLIDAENAQASVIGDLLREVARTVLPRSSALTAIGPQPISMAGEKLSTVWRSSQSSSSSTRPERTLLTPH